MAAYLNLPFEDTEINDLTRIYGNMIFKIPPAQIVDMKAVVEKLSQSFRLGIISDTGYISGVYIRKFLEQENILRFFQSTVFSDEQLHSKPHKSVFIKTAESLGIHMRDLIHIGDLERTDIAGAKNAGCIAVKFTGVHNDLADQENAHFVLNDYPSLFSILNQLINI